MTDTKHAERDGHSASPMAALLRTVEELWATSHAGLRRPPQQPQTAQAPIDRLAIVPSRDAPRLLIPAGNRRAAADSLRRYSADLSVRQVLERWAVATAVRVIGPRSPVLRDSVYVAAEAETALITYFSDVFGESVHVSLGIGTERANRKPVLQIFDGRGRSLGYAKIGGSSFTAELVLREADALERVSQVGWEAMRPPKIIHRGQWLDSAVLIMSPLSTTPMGRLRHFERLRHEAQKELRHYFAQAPQPLRQIPMLEGIRREAGQVADVQLRDRLLSTVELLLDSYGDTAIQLGATHGDWTAWNMAAHRGRLHVWDWERFDTGVPAGIDDVHFALNGYLQAHAVSPESVVAGLHSGAQNAETVGSTDYLLARVYLLGITTRYLAGARSVEVASIERKSAAMLKAAERMMGK